MPSYAITGASRGLGLELVKQLSATPANTVFALVRNPATALTLKDLAAKRPAVHVLKADVTDPDSLRAAAAAASTITGGTLDVLIHNAAEFDMASMALTPSQLPFDHDALWELCRSAMTTNVFGAIWSTNAFLPLIKKGTKKKVIHITTGMADLDFVKATAAPQAVTAGVAKAAMNLVTAKYAAEFASEGIKFLALSPGWVNTAEGPSKSRAARYSILCFRLEGGGPARWEVLLTGFDSHLVPPEMLPFVETLMAQFKRAEPNLQGPITKEDSVRMQLEIIEKLDEQLSGQFVSHHGNKYWF